MLLADDAVGIGGAVADGEGGRRAVAVARAAGQPIVVLFEQGVLFDVGQECDESGVVVDKILGVGGVVRLGATITRRAGRCRGVPARMNQRGWKSLVHAV